jgi:hypothetical protein
MTPEDWFAAIDPRPLFTFIAGKVKDAKSQQLPLITRSLRLFACACARQVWDLLTTDARSAIDAAERYAEGHATLTELLASSIRKRNNRITGEQLALSAAQAASGLPQEAPELLRHRNHPPFSPIDAAQDAARAVAIREIGPAPPGRPTTPEWQKAWTAAFVAARAVQADYFRDIFTPPRYRLKHKPRWITSTVLALARQMDQSGDFSLVPILADAIQDSGCVDETILNCCRTAGNNHVRGNWVVDLILGRI